MATNFAHIGIDPGQGGGIAWTDGTVTQCWPMPVTERDIRDRLESLGPPSHAVIESVHSMPKQGVASSFKFGRNYGFLRGCLICLGIPFEEVTPRTWMSGLGIRTRHKTETATEWKNHLKQIAQQLFPRQKVTLATADALLIAEYCRRVVAARKVA